MTTRAVHMTQETIDRWAGLSGDHNPLHVDPQFAAGTRFGGTIAHGHIALAVFSDLLLEAMGEDWLHGGVLENVKFRAPVRPDHVYTAQAAPTTPEAGAGAPAVWNLQLLDEQQTVCVEGTARLPSRPTVDH